MDIKDVVTLATGSLLKPSELPFLLLGHFRVSDTANTGDMTSIKTEQILKYYKSDPHFSYRVKFIIYFLPENELEMV